MLTALITMASMAVAGSAAWTGIGLIDQLHTTEQELLEYDAIPHSVHVAQFVALEAAISEIEIKSKCRWLDGQIRALDDSIYVRERDDADPDSIHDLEVALERLQTQYNALSCAKLLA